MPMDRVRSRTAGTGTEEALLHRTLDVLLDEVGVDGDGGGGALARGGDHLDHRIDDVPGRPHARDAGAARAVDDGEAVGVEIAAQAGQQAIGVWNVPRPDEHRLAGEDHAAVGKLDAGEVVGLDHRFGETSPCTSGVPRASNCACSSGVDLVGVSEEDHVVGPLANQLGVRHAPGWVPSTPSG